MGFEVVEKFRTIVTLPTVSMNRSNPGLDKKEKAELSCLDHEEEECRTPKSLADDMLRLSPLMCPPAPRKARKASCCRKSRPPSQGFFEVPDDLASVFILLPSPSKKMRTS